MGGSRRKIYRRLVDVNKVPDILSRYIKLEPRGIENIYIGDAVGRVLAENIYSRINLPPYTRALMDGYAVISEDVAEAWENSPVELKVIDRLATGDTRIIEVNRGECVEVSTGAIVPFPADAVVPVEYTSRVGNKVLVYRRVKHGENIDYVGSDAIEGEIIAWKGTILTPLLISSLAAAGINRVRVYRRIRVAIIPTGNELREVEAKLKYGEIYDSNSHMVYSLLLKLGAEPIRLPPVPDDRKMLRDTIDRVIDECDIVAVIGGTSAGLEDTTYRVFSEYNPGVIIHGIKTKPGRPLVIALSGDKILLGLPGFPLSCYLTSNLVLVPLVAKLQGISSRENNLHKAKLLIPIKGIPGLRYYVPVILTPKGEKLYAYPLLTHSGRIVLSSLVDGFAEIPENIDSIPAGSEVKVRVFPGQRIYEANIIGSHCPLLEEIIARVKERFNVRVFYTGSMGGLQMIKLGISDLSGIHLYDLDTGEYNIPYILKAGIKNAVLIRGYLREQGFVFKKEHKSIRTFKDIIDNNLRFVNRNSGSGTRILIDQLIEKEAIKHGISVDEFRSKLRGYTFEAKTHETVAYLISRGIADVGVAIRYVAERYGLSFHKISDEYFDFIVRKESLEKKSIEMFLEIVRSEGFYSILERFPGYKLLDNSFKIIARF